MEIKQHFSITHEFHTHTHTHTHTKDIRKHFKVKDNKTFIYPNVWNAAKLMLIEKIYSFKELYNKKEEKFKINILNLCIKKLEKDKQIKSKVSMREAIKGAELIEVEN